MDEKVCADKEKNTEQNGSSSEQEPSLSMVEVLEIEKELEDEYAAVLGASDENSCTFSQGPIKRQALYSCLTCNPGARADIEKCAGVCLACSYKCHENHDLIELYTKRNFRCDCPTSRFEKNVCVLNSGVEKPQPKNASNCYNQNFQGNYCTCHRPYPDPERTSEEIMIQCVMCEDWYHVHHLDIPAGAEKLAERCSEMICGNCMEYYSFLQDYVGFALTMLSEDNIEPSSVSVGEPDLEKNAGSTATLEVKGSASAKKEEDSENEPDIKRRKVEEKPNKKCTRPTNTTYEKGGTFWPNNWRTLLCKCNACLELYIALSVEFLVDPEDPAKSYEDRGMLRAATEASPYERGINALASMEHVQQIDAITEYNHMKERLKNYLQQFVINKQVVTEADIRRFFRDMRSERESERERELVRDQSHL